MFWYKGKRDRDGGKGIQKCWFYICKDFNNTKNSFFLSKFGECPKELLCGGGVKKKEVQLFLKTDRWTVNTFSIKTLNDEREGETDREKEKEKKSYI